MPGEDLDASDLVGPVDQHLTVEAAGAQQCRIEDLGTICGCQQDDAGLRIETVELDQQLVERLLLLVMAAAHRIGGAGASERIELVDEDDRRRLLARLLEQIM